MSNRSLADLSKGPVFDSAREAFLCMLDSVNLVRAHREKSASLEDLEEREGNWVGRYPTAQIGTKLRYDWVASWSSGHNTAPLCTVGSIVPIFQPKENQNLPSAIKELLTV